MDEEICTICKQPRSTHSARHPFTAEGEQLRADFMVKKPAPPQPVPMGVDPILRRTLIEAGVITADQIEEVRNRYLAENGALTGIPSQR